MPPEPPFDDGLEDVVLVIVVLLVVVVGLGVVVGDEDLNTVNGVVLVVGGGGCLGLGEGLLF